MKGAEQLFFHQKLFFHQNQEISFCRVGIDSRPWSFVRAGTGCDLTDSFSRSIAFPSQGSVRFCPFELPVSPAAEHRGDSCQGGRQLHVRLRLAGDRGGRLRAGVLCMLHRLSAARPFCPSPPLSSSRPQGGRGAAGRSGMFAGTARHCPGTAQRTVAQAPDAEVRGHFLAAE
jgi:hypothetical protein